MPSSKRILYEVKELPELDLPLFVYVDYGKNARVRLKDNHAELSLPAFIAKEDRARYYQWAIDWLYKKYKEDKIKPVSSKLIIRDGHVFRLMDEDYKLYILPSLDPKKAKIEKKGHEFIFRMPFSWAEEDQQDAIRSLSRKLIISAFRKPMLQRAWQLNEEHFNFEFHNLRLKYNKSNWGSCSSKGNLNFSIRLLFAPMKVIDSVIIHELAHIKHLNHSDNFWNLVHTHDKYANESEQWLRQHARTDFI